MHRLILPIVHQSRAYYAYLKEFNESTTFKSVGGLAVIEHQYMPTDTPNYLMVWVRQGATENEVVRRGTRGANHNSNESLDDAFTQSRNYLSAHYGINQHAPLLAFSHPIALSQEQAANLNRYWANPQQRAPVHKDNCVSFIPCLELGNTETNATPAERNFISHHLGFSRIIPTMKLPHDFSMLQMKIIQLS